MHRFPRALIWAGLLTLAGILAGCAGAPPPPPSVFLACQDLRRAVEAAAFLKPQLTPGGIATIEAAIANGQPICERNGRPGAVPAPADAAIVGAAAARIRAVRPGGTP